MSDNTFIKGPAADDDVIDLRAYVSVIGKYKWRILVFAIMVTALVAVVVAGMTPVYQSRARLLIEADEAKAVSIQEIYGLDSSRQEYFETQFEILKSRRLAELVIERMDLANHPEFNADAVSEPNRLKALQEQAKALLAQYLPMESDASVYPDEYFAERRKAALLAAFQTKLQITPVRKTQLVDITYEASDPKLAADIANTLGEVYIEMYLDDKMQLTQKASDWLKTRLDSLRIKVRESEQRLQSFREQNGLIDIEGVQTLSSNDINDLNAQLQTVRKRRTDLQSLIDLAQQRQASGDMAALISIPEISEHQLVAQIKRDEADAERELAQLAQRYGPRHDKMIAAKARLVEVRASVSRRVASLVEGLRQEYQKVLASEQALQSQLAQSKQGFQAINRAETEYRELQREVETNQRLYDTFLTRMKETGAVGDFQSAHARFADRAEPALSPAKPKRKMIVVATFVVMLLLGMLMALVLDSLSDTIETANDVELYLAQRVMGIIPQISTSRRKPVPLYQFFEAKAHKFSEAWRTLRTGYVLSKIDQPAKTVAITSTVPGEGKTTTAINFAFALAQVERVVLVDADMRRPALGKQFQIPNYQPGLSNLLTGTHTIQQCIYRDERAKLDVIVAGSLVNDPVALLSGPEFPALIARLSELYDRVIIDTPPAHVVSDAMAISRVTDSVIYVVQAETVRRKIIRGSLAKLQSMKIRIDGVVLNRISSKAGREHYGHSYDGYYSYGYGRPAVKEKPAKDDKAA